MIRVLIGSAALVVTVTALPVPMASAEPPPGRECGVDLSASVIAVAIHSLRPAFPDMDVAWDPIPYGGNFDRCATLSTALVTIVGATGSSPDQALFFHHGDYLGTATWNPYSFTSLNIPLTTDNTVVLDYKDSRYVCTACPGPITTVRYQWQDDRVQMLDRPPPAP